MAQTKTFKCSNCGTEISAKGFSLFCPNCKKPIIVRIVALIIGIVVWIIAIVEINGTLHRHDKELADIYGYNKIVTSDQI